MSRVGAQVTGCGALRGVLQGDIPRGRPLKPPRFEKKQQKQSQSCP